jgi:DNA (cytosine-5)-methyltransferase 1
MKKLKVLSLFSGIGAFEKALTNLHVDFELVGFSEIDKYAIKSYCAIHNIDESLNLGDVSKVETDNIPDFNLMTYAFPCQDISVAGRQKGFGEGTNTRSSLLWEAMKIANAKKPKYMIAENVKNLIGKKFKEDFDKYINYLDELGYNTYYQVLNAKEFGVPQSRERVFVVSIRKDVDHNDFKFRTGQDNGIRLKDILESNVEDKYYLSDNAITRLINNNKGFHSKVHNEDSNGFAATLFASMYKISRGMDLIQVRNMNNGEKIRRLTPLECWRLMGFSDDDFNAAKSIGTSDTQLYKQAGNSIVVKVLEPLLLNLLKENKQISHSEDTTYRAI